MKRRTQAEIDEARCYLAARVTHNGEGYTSKGVTEAAYKMEVINACMKHQQGKLNYLELAELIRQAALNTTTCGSLTYRDGEIVCMLAELRRRGFPLFPGRYTRLEGQVYACDLVIEAFEKIGIEIQIPGLEKIWRTWSRRHPEIRTIFQK